MHEKQSGHNIFQTATMRLAGLYPKSESESLVYWLMEDLLGVRKVDIALGRAPVGELDSFEKAMTRLAAGEPIQYVLGYAWFRGLKFAVEPGVLIPRPETEVAVEQALAVTPANGAVLDIGTGSGCIALTVAKERSDAKVTAWDVSPQAMSITRKNAEKLGVSVNVERVDVMASWPDIQVDVVVSNPPYVLETEKEQMHRNVLEHEPSLALFVPDSDPLRFYREIAQKARGILSAHGQLVLEINERKATETVDLLSVCGYGDLQVIQDFYGKDRVVRGTL